jgi:hypothetical protein
MGRLYKFIDKLSKNFDNPLLFTIKIKLILFDTLLGAGVKRWGFYSMRIVMGVGGWLE